MTPDKAKQIIIDGEGQTTEFKESFGQTRPAVETLCAFAHAEGGRLFFGVDDDRNVRGVEIGRRTLEQFAQTLRQETDPPLDVSISEILMEQGKSVVAIEVAEAAPGSDYSGIREISDPDWQIESQDAHSNDSVTGASFSQFCRRTLPPYV